MANIVYLATSLDGYIARKDGNIDWLMEIPNPDQSDYGFSEFMERVDAILMGRKTFETVKDFRPWPYDKPVFVLSRSLKELPPELRSKVETIQGELRPVLDSLKSKGIQNLYVDGGLTIQSFLKEDLVDELIITRIPILLGTGIPLFGEMEQELKFDLINTELLNKDLVKSTYKRRR
jgi:dihydrofolate reductase